MARWRRWRRSAPASGPDAASSSTSAFSRRACRWRSGKRAATSPPARCPGRWAPRTRPARPIRRCVLPMASSPCAPLLPRGASPQARPGEADRLADAALRNAAAHGPRRPDPRRALGRSARRAGLFAGRDRRARRGGRDPGGVMSAEEILFEIKGDGIAWLTFNRPEARNAMTFGMYRRLGEICRELDAKVKVLILR